MRKIFMSVLVIALTMCLFVSCASFGSGKQKSKTEKTSASPAEYEVISVEPDQPVEDEKPLAVADDETNWLSALGDIKNLNVASYMLRGEGPDGASFDWIEVKGTKVALSDVRRGQWTLYAKALGPNGELLATGKLETFLSNSSPTGVLYLDPESGEGSARCSFAWNTFQVLYPEIEIYLKKGNGEYVPRSSDEIAMGDGVAVWNAREIGAGSYTVRAILKDEGEIVAGVAAAMRVIDGKLSVGDVRFIVGKLSTIYGISLDNSPVSTIQGSLVLSNQGGLSYVSDSRDLRYDWFFNGEYLSGYGEANIDIASLGLSKGFYRIDVIVQDSNETSINSSSILLFVNGTVVRQVTEAEADGAKDDVPEGYSEIVTNSESFVEGSKDGMQAAPKNEAELAEPAESAEPVEDVDFVFSFKSGGELII